MGRNICAAYKYVIVRGFFPTSDKIFPRKWQIRGGSLWPGESFILHVWKEKFLVLILIDSSIKRAQTYNTLRF